MTSDENIFDFQILRLTNVFYEHYDKTVFPEILLKSGRSYNCLLIQSRYGYFICIPYRSEINHPFAFKFKNTRRSKKHNSGLDYTKIVIIDKSQYITSKSSIIDKDEYMKTKRFISTIKNEAISYIDDYVNHIKGIKIMEGKEFDRKYGRSTLKYFHRELNIDKV
ncbi:MAG: hypothetical protein HFG85_01920 [Dorea sp.]|nr:hypothetical protein [Dorea sp.]